MSNRNKVSYDKNALPVMIDTTDGAAFRRSVLAADEDRANLLSADDQRRPRLSEVDLDVGNMSQGVPSKDSFQTGSQKVSVGMAPLQNKQ